MFIIMILFLLMAIINTIFLRFPQFKIFKNIKNSGDKRTKQTFLLGLATNLGVGNLIGVGAAIYYGGPGVIFWMSIFAFFASSFAYSETKNAIISQTKINNETRSSTSLVIKKFFPNKLGIIGSALFSLFLILTNSVFFPPIQVYSIVNIFSESIKLLIGIALIISIIIITNKGTKGILKVTDLLLPIISISYFLLIVILIFVNRKTLLLTIIKIFQSAFNFRSITTSSIFLTIEVGISKSLFSHEAGLGTMPSLIGIASKDEKEQMCSYQVLSVIIDTVLLCSLTGIYILQITNGEFTCNIAQILVECFKISLGNFGLVICKIFILFFGFSSIIGQFYLGQTNCLSFGSIFKKINLRILNVIFKIIFYIGVLIGIFMNFEFIDNLLEYGMVMLGIINILVIFTIQFREKKEHKNLKN